MNLYLQSARDFLFKTYNKKEEISETNMFKQIIKKPDTLRICLYDINEFLCPNKTNTNIGRVIDIIKKIDCDILLLHNYVPYLYIDDDKTIPSMEHFDTKINKEYSIKLQYKEKLKYFKGWQRS